MKSLKTISFFLTAALIATGLSSCERTDYPDRYRSTDGVPTIYGIRYVESDTHIEQAFMEEVICVMGENLRSIHDIYFNDQPAILNTSYITDNTLLVQVPKTMPTVETDKIYFNTVGKQTVEYAFRVLPPAPRVQRISLECASDGQEVTIYGNYFYQKSDSPIVIEFPNAVAGPIADEDITLTSVKVRVPEGAQTGKIKVTTASGTAASEFVFRDDRGLLFDFDGKTGLGADHGWHARVIATDDTAVSGNYVLLGDGTAPLTNWDDSHFAFEYWCGSWDTPQNITTAPNTALFNLVDFSDFSSMIFKFEMCIPEESPWCDFPMQIAFQGIDQVTLSGNPVEGFDKVGGANATIFNGDDALGTYGRAHYSPWAETGSFHTNGEWITVSIPLSDFNLDKDGKEAAFKATKATDFGSLSMFITGASTTGTACTPLIKIDNIRVVPAK